MSLILLGLVMIGRAAFVFPLSFLSNLAKKSPNDKIDFKQQVGFLSVFLSLFLVVITSSSSNERNK